MNAATLEDIKDELQAYLSLRDQATYSNAANNSISNSASNDYNKDENPFEFLRPTGWFRDEYKLDIEKRSDKRTPKISHPLSFVELEKYGYGKLSESIVNLGGPDQVGLAIGLDWKAPVEVFIVDESLRPKREETYAFDVAGSLSIGGSLEEKLEAAAKLDLEKLKRDIDINSNLQGDSDVKNQDSAEIDYRRRKISKAKKSWKNGNQQDKFYLNSSQRAYCLGVFMSFALGNGHASADLLIQAPDSGVEQLIDVFKVWLVERIAHNNSSKQSSIFASFAVANVSDFIICDGRIIVRLRGICRV